MSRTMTRNHEHFRRALGRLPLGVASNFRFWGEERTIYVKEGRGARVTDLDGNVYVDYRMGYGPAILGYADPRVDAAAREGMEVGGVFALSTEREYRVAERIARMVPAAELVRFSNSGTEAVMAAEVGHLDLAYDYLVEAALLDLQDLEHNTRDGVHIAALAGAWIALVDGFGGMRNRGDNLCFSPRLPRQLERLEFKLRYRGRTLQVTALQRSAVYTLLEGEPVQLSHHGQPFVLTRSEPVTHPVPPAPDRPRPSQPPGREPFHRHADS